MINFLVPFVILASFFSCDDGDIDAGFLEMRFMESAKKSCSPKLDLQLCNSTQKKLQSDPRVSKLQSLEKENQKRADLLKRSKAKVQLLQDSIWEIHDSSEAVQRKINEHKLSAIQYKCLSWLIILLSAIILLLSLRAKPPRKLIDNACALLNERLSPFVVGRLSIVMQTSKSVAHVVAHVIGNTVRKKRFDVALLVISLSLVVTFAVANGRNVALQIISIALLAMILIIKSLLFAYGYAIGPGAKISRILQFASVFWGIFVSPIAAFGGNSKNALAFTIIGIIVYALFAYNNAGQKVKGHISKISTDLAVAIMLVGAAYAYRDFLSCQYPEPPKIKFLAVLIVYNFSFFFLSRTLWRNLSFLEKLICALSLLAFDAQMAKLVFSYINGISASGICIVRIDISIIPLYGSALLAFAYFKPFQHFKTKAL